MYGSARDRNMLVNRSVSILRKSESAVGCAVDQSSSVFKSGIAIGRCPSCRPAICTCSAADKRALFNSYNNCNCS